jgi:hypothetical protein
MIGGLLKSTSRVALIAAAGLFVGGVAVPSAKAADLGGDCCADLEERVAELEATTARKGNRKMSLTISGQVHRMVLWYDDGHRSDTYYGIDNTHSSSRFFFLGSARINPSVSMGFEIAIEVEAGGTGSKLNQFDEDGKVGGQINGLGAASFNAGSSNDAYFGDARRVAWWIEHKDVGRVTVGRFEGAGAMTTIDLGGIAAAAGAAYALIPGSMLIRGPSGEFYAVSWNRLGDAGVFQNRNEVVRYDSPTWQGFILSSSVGEAGDYWGTMLRYAGEFSGVRIAAGIGYETATDRNTSVACFNLNAGAAATTCATGTGAGPADLAAIKGEAEIWGASLALMHVPSGLFVQGHYIAGEYSKLGATGHMGQDVADKKDIVDWLVQGGIAKNWFGLGNTVLYGEYGVTTDWGATNAGRNYSATTIPGATAVNGVVDTELTVWGLGVVQNVDAAASQLYLGYRNFSADIGCISTGANCTGTGGTGSSNSLATENMHVVIGGALVRF